MQSSHHSSNLMAKWAATTFAVIFVYGGTACLAIQPYDHREVVNCEAGPCEGQTTFRTGLPIYQLDQSIDPTIKPDLCKNVSVSETDVARDFFHRHYHWERPLIDATKPINIEIRLVLQSINDVVERDRLLKLTGYLIIYWFDEFHVWNKTFPHACLSYVVMPPTEVWIPEIAMTNSAQHYELLLMHGEELVRVDSNGHAKYRPGGTFGVFCDFDLTYFPFDEQVCMLTMESWRYTVENQIFHFGDEIQIKSLENDQWKLVNKSQSIGTTQYTATKSEYATVEFKLQLKRKIGYYMINVIIPSIIISIAEVATFTLPVDETMKIHISFTCLLAYGVFQLMIIADIPRTSERIPLLCYYIALSMAYICFAMLGEGMVFVCLRKGQDKQHKHYVPNIVYKYACFVGRALKIKHVDEPPDHQHQTNDSQDPGHKTGVRSLVSNRLFISLVHPIVPSAKHHHHQQQHVKKPPHREPFTTDQLSAATATDESEDSKRRKRWEYLADVLDRLVLVIYLLFIIATPIIMFVIVPSNSSKSSA